MRRQKCYSGSRHAQYIYVNVYLNLVWLQGLPTLLIT